MHVQATCDGTEAQFIGGAMEITGLETATSRPHGEGINVVVTAGAFAGFAHGCAAKFTAPDHEGVFEQSALFQVEDERYGRLIDFFANLIKRSVQIGAFADPASARDVRTKVERLGLTTYTHVIEVAGAPRIRVRVGPMSDRDEAQRILDRLKQAGLPGAVLTL